MSSHNLSCAVSCPNIFVLNTNETVLPAAFTASSCEKFTEVIPWFGDKLGLSNAGTKFRNISPTPSVMSLPPLPPLPWKKTEEMYQLCISGTRSSQKKRQLLKNEEECSGTGICKHRSAIYNNYSNRFAGASKTDNHHSAFQMIKKLLKKFW